MAHHRSVSVLVLLHKIRCHSMNSLYGALPMSYVSARVTRCPLVAHRYMCKPPLCTTSQNTRTFIANSVSLWNDLGDPVLFGVGLEGECLLLSYSTRFLSVFSNFSFLFVLFWVDIIGLGSSD